jgi:hypothetical protein
MKKFVLGFVVFFSFVLVGCATKPTIGSNGPSVPPISYQQPPPPPPPSPPKRILGDQIPTDDFSHFVDLRVSNSTNAPLYLGVYYVIEAGKSVVVDGLDRVRTFLNTLIRKECEGYESYEDREGVRHIETEVTSCTD